MTEEIKITYETLFDLLRREKNREDLQPLEQSFYSDVIAYLAEKVNALESLSSETDPMADNTEREQIRRQLANISKILRDLYERRERKIISLALNKSRTGSEIVSSSTLLKEERQFLDGLVGLFGRYRSGVLHNLLRLKDPAIAEQPAAAAATEDKPKAVEGMQKSSQEEGQEEGQESYEEQPSRVIFVNRVEEFIGPELEIYGPFQPDDEAELPKTIAEMLIKQGHAEPI